MSVMNTKCPHPDCKTPKLRRMYACRNHWHGLPKTIQLKIQRGYQKDWDLWRQGHNEAQSFWKSKEDE